MSEKVYFGTGPLPKGHRHPTMKESVDNSQVRYYGLHKIDNRLIAKGKKAKGPNRDKIGLEMIKLRGRVKNLTSKANLEKDPVKKAEFAAQLEKAKADLDKVKQLFNEADKGKVAKVAKVVKAVQKKDINIPFVDPSVYDQVAEDLYNRTELQKDQVKGLIKSMTKLKKIPIKKHSDLSKIEQIVETLKENINDLKTEYNDLEKSFKQFQKNPSAKEAQVLSNFISKIIKDCKNIGYQASFGKSHEEMAAKQGLYEHVVHIYNNVMMLQQKLQEQPMAVKAKTPIKAKTLVTVKNPLTEALNKLKEQEKELTKDVKKLKNNSNYRLSDAKEIQYDIKKFVKEYQGLEKKIKKLPNNKKLLADIAYLDDKVDDMELILEEFFDEHEDGDDDDDDY